MRGDDPAACPLCLSPPAPRPFPQPGLHPMPQQPLPQSALAVCAWRTGTKSTRGMLSLGHKAGPRRKPRLLKCPAWSAARLWVPMCMGPRRTPRGWGERPGARFPSLHPSHTPWPQPAPCPSLLPSLPDLNSLVLIPWHPLPGRGHQGGGRELLGDGCVLCTLCAGKGHPPPARRTCCHSD